APPSLLTQTLSPPPGLTLFPYTTLFRSVRPRGIVLMDQQGTDQAGQRRQRRDHPSYQADPPDGVARPAQCDEHADDRKSHDRERSEERRVGKGCKSRNAPCVQEKKVDLQ